MAYTPTPSRASGQAIAVSIPKHDRLAALAATTGPVSAATVTAPAAKGSTATGKVQAGTVTVPSGHASTRR